MFQLTGLSIRATYTINSLVNYLITPWLCPTYMVHPQKDPFKMWPLTVVYEFSTGRDVYHV